MYVGAGSALTAFLPGEMTPARRWLVLPLVIAAGVAIAVLLQANRDEGAADPGPVDVHGLGVNPGDGALFIAAHNGLYRLAPDGERAVRVGDSFQDTTAFTVAGPDRFLGSGHPDLRDDLPPLLGLIESTDGGASWKPISLLGEADFHLLRSAGDRVYGYDASGGSLLLSVDRGRTWSTRTVPGPIGDLVVAPGDSRRLLASVAGSLLESRDGGETWSRVGEVSGLLAWPSPARLYVLTAGGRLLRSRDGGRRLEVRGQVGGEPAALLAVGPDELVVALLDGTIERSADGGRTWAVRARP